MNRIILLLAAPFIFFTAQADQITQTEADNIVLERMSPETRQYTIYAKDGVQQKMTITSVDGEVLDVNYKFWCYYIEYIDNTGQYIIVKESNGNLLEVNVKGEAKPEDLRDWRILKAIEITLVNTKWKLIGIVDVQTGGLTELEPTDCEECYTLTFDTDSTFSGQMVANIMLGKYKIDYKTDILNFSDFVATEVGSIWNKEESLYHQILWEIQSFIIKDTYPRTLHLYYNDGKNYFKYEENNAPPEKYDIFEKRDISACEVSNPLQNIEWLREYCNNIKGKKDIAPVRINLYKVINKDEYFFRISVPSPIKYSTLYFLNCNGETIFTWHTMTPPGGPYNDFMKDKEFVAELFYFIKQ